MNLTQDFRVDFRTLTAGLDPDYKGPPYAFARFGDGEVAIMEGREYHAVADGWSVAGGPAGLPSMIAEAVGWHSPGYFVGISAAGHNGDAHDYLHAACGSPECRITYAEIFSFANYGVFSLLDLRHCAVVSSAPEASRYFARHLPVPAKPDDPGWPTAFATLARTLPEMRRPILVSAGPWSGPIIQAYWERPERVVYGQVILDVGSSIDPKIRGRCTRRHHNPGNARASWVPRFRPK